MSDERSEFIEKYEKSYETALKLEKVMVKYFDQMYGEYLYEIETRYKGVHFGGVNYSAEELIFKFCFDEDVSYSKARDIRKKIWDGFNQMFNFELGKWGCPIDVEFYQLKKERL